MVFRIELQPADEHNQKLEGHVRPPDWVNPVPEGRYNLVVVGAGPAGLVAAAGAAALGAKVALVERALMGGDCLNVGCVPSKAVLSCARVARIIRHAGEFGIEVPAGVTVDFARVMERMRRLRAQISVHDSVRRYRELGVDVYLGHGCFTSSNTLQVGDRTLSFRKALIATGSRPAIPPIPGLDQIAYLTNESVFSLTELPRRLAVIGAGPIGCELAQAFANFGSRVVLVEAVHGILPLADRQAAEVVRQSMERDGVRLLCCGEDVRLHKDSECIRLVGRSHGQLFDEAVDQVLVCAGRLPNVDGLGLEAAGVEFHPRSGIRVNDHLQTTNPHIYAAGDVCSAFKFTHAADFMARIALQNALFLGRARVSTLTIPWCIYTFPEIAQVGLGEKDALERGIQVDSYIQELAQTDRAILTGETEGFVKLYTRKKSHRIVGATIVAAHAGELISEVCLSMTNGLGLKHIGKTIHPYPTQAEAIRKLADQYQRTRLTPLLKKLLQTWLAWTR